MEGKREIMRGEGRVRERGEVGGPYWMNLDSILKWYLKWKHNRFEHVPSPTSQQYCSRTDGPSRGNRTHDLRAIQPGALTTELGRLDGVVSHKHCVSL